MVNKKEFDRIDESRWDFSSNSVEIKGDKYPLWYAKLINKVLENELPFVLFLGPPGTGKTWAAAKLGYDLTHKLGFYEGDYKPKENIHYDNLNYLKKFHSTRNEVLHKPEINTTLHALDYRDKGNREFEVMVNLGRRFGNLITGDAQMLARCDRAIKDTHTFRAVATGGEDQYHFNIFFIESKSDEEKRSKSRKAHYIMTWKPGKPPKEFREYVEEKDDSWKSERLKEGIDVLEKKRREEQQQNQRFEV